MTEAQVVEEQKRLCDYFDEIMGEEDDEGPNHPTVFTETRALVVLVPRDQVCKVRALVCRYSKKYSYISIHVCADGKMDIGLDPHNLSSS